MSRPTRGRGFDHFAKTERQVKRAGCLFAVLWLCSVLLSLVLSCSVIACVVFGAYYLATGEFLF